LAHQLDEANARIAILAHEDPLTGLPNRRTFLDLLDAALRTRNRDKSELAVLFLDLDGFKDANDTLGHAAGDALLMEVADRLRRAVRQSDVVARFGGDEFAVMQTNISEPGDAGTLAEKIGSAIAKHYVIGDADVAVTASIGITQTTATTNTATDLMVQADLALYRAKADGRDCYRFYNSDLDRQVRTRALLARELQLGIERNEFELFYQPQVEIATGRIVGLGTMARWNHPSRGIIEPSTFVSIAERTSAILAIGDWVLEEACGQMRRWQDDEIAPPVCAIDISGAQLKSAAGIVADLKMAIDKHGIRAESVELEFTELVLMHAAQHQAATLDSVRDLGFRMSISDFGNGYSSIGYLARTPVQRLTIPQAFVAGVPHSDVSARAIRAIVQVGRELNIDVIADGVETQAQAQFILAAGCGQAQGPFFGPIVRANEATVLLRRSKVASRLAARVGTSAA
jgi:diguanylate cyclase (GGDEF)-like protein